MAATRRLQSFGRRQCLAGVLVLVLAVLMALSAPLRAQERMIRLAVGAATVIALTENPSTGYRWQLNGAASRNISRVSVSDAGFAAATSGRIGAPGVRRFEIAARQPGTVVAVFVYVRPWEHVAPVRRHVVTIDIGIR